MKKAVKTLLCLLMIISIASCATFGSWSRKPVYPTDLDATMKQMFSAAEQNYFNGNFAEAERGYQNYIVSYGYNELTDEARFKLGEIYFARKKYKNALSYYQEAYQNLYNPSISPKAQFKAALTLSKLRRNREAFSVLEGMQRRDVTPVLGLRSDSLAINIGKELKYKRDGLIKWYLFLLDDYAVISPADTGKVREMLVAREVAQKEVSSWVKDANVTKEAVDELPFKAMKGKPSGGYVLYKLALVHYSHGNIKEASKLMRRFVRGYPKNEFAIEASTLLAELKGKTTGKKYKIGVILPLSGRFGLYGNSTLHGLQCAAGLTPPCSSPLNIELIVKDSTGDPVRTSNVVAELAKEGVVAIVGPLLSMTVVNAAQRAQELRVPLISLSQKDGVAEMGSFIFKHALTPQDQVDTLVDYVVGKQKKKKFGILYPSNKYGSHFARLFRSAVHSAGGKIVYQQRYSHSDLKAFLPSKKRKERTGSAGTEGTITSGGVTTGGVTTGMRGSYVEGMGNTFDVPSTVQALFIPDSYKAVKYVVVAVHSDSEKLSSNIVFMGVNRWNNPGLTSHDIGLLNGSVFVDGFYKKSADVTTRAFVQSFVSAFGMEPTILEAQAFDALKIVIAGIRGGGGSRSKLSAAMSRVKNLGGATGSINIDEHGNSRRKLFILTVKRGSIAELSSSREFFKNMKKPKTSSASKKRSNTKYGDEEKPVSNSKTNSKY